MSVARPSAATPPPAPAAPPAARQFVRGSVGSGVAVVARAAGALLLNKLLAVYGGPGGLTLLAHFQNLMALFTTLPNDGTHVGLVKYLAPLPARAGRYRAWLGAALLLNGAALALGLVALLLFPGPLVGVFQPSVGWVALFGLGIALLTAYALLGAVLLAAGQLRAYVGLTVALSLLGPAAVAAVLAGGGVATTALLAYLLAQGATLLPALWLTHRAGLLPALWPGRLSKAALRGLGRFLLMAVGLLLFGKAVDFAVRELLIRQFSLAETDLWQAVAKLSDNYTMVMTAVMSSVYYPRLAALAPQPAAQRAWVRTVLRMLVPLLAAGLGLLYMLRHWLLPVLFEARFGAAAGLLGSQLLGDWLRFVAWPLVMVLTAQARVGRYVALQAASAVLYAAALALLLPRLGLVGAVWASALRHGLLLLWCGWYFRRFWVGEVTK
jgi:PST family polysaccharide transporter